MQHELLTDGIPLYVAFLFSATLHEAAHAWAAKRGGDLTAYRGGQVSIDPMPHIRREPFGLVILPLLFLVTRGWPLGFASAPYDPRWARRYPRRAAWMALAGPAANLGIFLVVLLLIKLGFAAGVLASPERYRFAEIVVATGGGAWIGAAKLLSVFFSMNLLLLLFNLIPLPPLDGAAAIQLAMSESLALRYQDALATPMFSWGGIIVAWLVFPRVFVPVFHTLVAFVHGGSF